MIFYYYGIDVNYSYLSTQHHQRWLRVMHQPAWLRQMHNDGWLRGEVDGVPAEDDSDYDRWEAAEEENEDVNAGGMKKQGCSSQQRCRLVAPEASA